MYIPTQRKMLFLTGIIFLSLFSTAYLVNSFTGSLTLPEAEIKFNGDEDPKSEDKDMDLEKGYQIPGFYDEKFEYKEATMTEEEVLAIAEALEEVQEFRADHENVSVWVWYDGFDYWYVDYSVDYWNEYYIEYSEFITGEIGYKDESVTDYSYYPEWSYLTVIIQDSSGGVYEIIRPVEPSLTEEEVYDIAVNSEAGLAFFEDYPDAELFIWFDSFQFWYVEFYPPYKYLEHDDYGYTDEQIVEPECGYVWDYLSMVIDDLTGEIVETFRPIDPSLSEEEVIDLAFSILEIQELAEKYDDLKAWAYFDGYEYWYVNIYSYEHWEVWAYVTIDDTTADVVDFYVPELPVMSEEDIIAIAMEHPMVQEFLSKYENSSVHAYFYGEWSFFDETGEKQPELGDKGDMEAYWHVYVYSGIYLDAWGHLLISDAGEIIETNFFMPELPIITYDEAITITQGHALTIEFIETHSDDYGMYAYHYSEYFHYQELNYTTHETDEYSLGLDYKDPNPMRGVWYIVYYSPTKFDWWYIEGKEVDRKPVYSELGFIIDSETGQIIDTWYYDWEEEIIQL
ncbi:MAG: hypothetical protein ACFFAE_05170 [Candidatus Hodarchaeota archaeon]